MNVLVVIQRVEKVHDVLAGGAAEFDEILGEVAHFGSDVACATDRLCDFPAHQFSTSLKLELNGEEPTRPWRGCQCSAWGACPVMLIQVYGFGAFLICASISARILITSPSLGDHFSA